jgi:hypothetical protein
MGDIYLNDDYQIQSHIDGLNLRFAPGEPIGEMVRLQKEFKFFSAQHSLQDSISLLNVAGASWDLQEKWYRLLTWIAGLNSNRAGQKGGPAIVAALSKNLASSSPSPVYFKSHNYYDEKKVLVNTKGETPIFYIEQEYLTVSLPLRKKES